MSGAEWSTVAETAGQAARQRRRRH